MANRSNPLRVLSAVALASGLVDAELFDRLRDHLPRQAAVIGYVRARWLGP